MNAQEIYDLLKNKFGESILESKLDALQPWVRIAADHTKEIAFFLRDEHALDFDYMSSLSGVDYNDGTFGVVYHLASMKYKHKIVLKVKCPRDNPHVQSVSSVWGTANWHEREAYDMYGIVFDEHPDLRRLLMADDWVGHPLRKDYKTPEFYNGMKVPY
jgi:NADH-quinone oxidoreductase subunit C